MTDLPQTATRPKKHVGVMFVFGGLEAIAKALHYGDGFQDMEGLEELGRRCRAVADLIDKRIEQARGANK